MSHGVKLSRVALIPKAMQSHGGGKSVDSINKVTVRGMLLAANNKDSAKTRVNNKEIHYLT